MIRRISCLLLILTLIALSLASVSAKECVFSLSDASVKKGRLFEVSFSADSKEKIASFVAEFTFDSKYLKFNSCKTADENGVIEVNQIDGGKLRVVYLCEDGTDSPVLTLTFKAIQEGNTEINCDASQVVNTGYEDITALSCEPAMINIYLSHKDVPKETDVIQDSTEETVSDYSKSVVTVVEGNSSKTEIIIFSALVVMCLVCIAGYISYKAGKRAKRKKESNEK